MSATIHVAIDNISPRLEKLLRRGNDAHDVLRAMGTQVTSIASRAFSDPGMRIAAWEARKKTKFVANTKRPGRQNLVTSSGGSTNQLLKKSGALLQSIGRAPIVMGTSVSVGSDRPYAAIHQFGGKTGRGHKVTIPARPFFPFNKSGAMAPWAMEKVAKAAEAAMRKKMEL